jgi:hypothetical protein
MNMPDEHDNPPCLLIMALGVAMWVVILFVVTYAIYWIVN